MTTFRQHPDDHLDYDIDATDWLDVVNDTISQATATINPNDTGDLEVASKQIYDDRVKIWLRKGQEGTTYQVWVQIQTDAGRKKTVPFRVKVAKR